VPPAVFDAICKICQSKNSSSPTPVRKGTEIVLIDETRPIYYFDNFAFPRKKDPRAVRLIREIEKQHVSRKIPREVLPQTPCRWILISRDQVPYYQEANTPGRFWVMISPPIFNPLAKRSRAVGVFMRLAGSHNRLRAFGAERWWIPLAKWGKAWVALEPVRANVIEF
jgi:hypothetical protein